MHSKGNPDLKLTHRLWGIVWTVLMRLFSWGCWFIKIKSCYRVTASSGLWWMKGDAGDFPVGHFCSDHTTGWVTQMLPTFGWGIYRGVKHCGGPTIRVTNRQHCPPWNTHKNDYNHVQGVMLKLDKWCQLFLFTLSDSGNMGPNAMKAFMSGMIWLKAGGSHFKLKSTFCEGNLWMHSMHCTRCMP